MYTRDVIFFCVAPSPLGGAHARAVARDSLCVCPPRARALTLRLATHTPHSLSYSILSLFCASESSLTSTARFVVARTTVRVRAPRAGGTRLALVLAATGSTRSATMYKYDVLCTSYIE